MELLSSCLPASCGVAVGAAITAAFSLDFQQRMRTTKLEQELEAFKASVPPQAPKDWQRRKGEAEAILSPMLCSTHYSGTALRVDDEVMAAGWQGWTMEEARAHAGKGAKKAQEKTPAEVLEALQRGNTRFWTGRSSRPEFSAFERRALMVQQFPNAAVLGCSDSRVPVEFIFDQGVGDLFVIRVAGNFLDRSAFASLEFAALHVGVKLLVVLGHEGCGAVKAAELPAEKIDQEPEMLRSVLHEIKAGLDETRLKSMRDNRAREREAVVTNILRQIQRLATDQNIMKLVREKKLMIVGAFYEISSGIVDFISQVDECSIDNLPITQQKVRRGVTARMSFDEQKDEAVSPKVADGTPSAKAFQLVRLVSAPDGAAQIVE